LTAPPPKNNPAPPYKNVAAPPPDSLPVPPTGNLSAPHTRNVSARAPKIPASQTRTFPDPPPTSNNTSLSHNLPVLPPKDVSTPPKLGLHPIPKPYTHPMPQTVPRPIGHPERELRKRPRSVTGVSTEGRAESGRKRMCLNPGPTEIIVDNQVDGEDKHDVEGSSCQRRKERPEMVAKDAKKRSESEGFVEKSGTDQRKDNSGFSNSEKKKPERLSPRLLLNKEKSDGNKFREEYTTMVSSREKSAAEKIKQKVTEKSKDGVLKEEAKEKLLFNNNNKAVVNKNKKIVEEKAKLLNSKKSVSANTELLSTNKKVGGQILLGSKKALKSGSPRTKLLLDKKSVKQKPTLLNTKKTATGQRPKLLKCADQRPKPLNLKKAVSVSKGPKLINCKKSPSDKPKMNMKKSPSDKSKLLSDKKCSAEKKRVDSKPKTGGPKADQGGMISSRRRSNRKKSVDNSWQWVGEPETKLVFTGVSRIY
jgi:hypothetical protein